MAVDAATGQKVLTFGSGGEVTMPSAYNGAPSLGLPDLSDADQYRDIATMPDGQGYVVLDASNGGEALMIAEQHPGTIDLLLTDVSLGEVSGIDVASAFREANPDRPIIFTSGYGGQEMLRTAERVGGVFLEKPYDITRLARAVEDALVTNGQRLDSKKEARE